MDYPFFLMRVGTASDTLLAYLRQQFLQSDLKEHPAFRGQRVTTTGYCQLKMPAIDSIRVMLPELEHCRYSGAEFNVLNGGQTIREHTDIATKVPGLAHKIMNRHKLHVVLETTPVCRVYHRRSVHCAASSTHMESGGVYLFNDYVLHSVANLGEAQRVHALMSFDDPLGLVRPALLERLGLESCQAYEANNVYPTATWSAHVHPSA